MEYYEKLKVFFTQKGLKQKEVADIMEYSPAMIGRYLKGSDKINSDFITVLVQKFPDIDLQYIFSDSPEEEVQQSFCEPEVTYLLSDEDIIKDIEDMERKLKIIRIALARKKR